MTDKTDGQQARFQIVEDGPDRFVLVDNETDEPAPVYATREEAEQAMREAGVSAPHPAQERQGVEELHETLAAICEEVSHCCLPSGIMTDKQVTRYRMYEVARRVADALTTPSPMRDGWTEELLALAAHYHVAGTTKGLDIDTCAECGLDLRHDVHSNRANDAAREHRNKHRAALSAVAARRENPHV